MAWLPLASAVFSVTCTGFNPQHWALATVTWVPVVPRRHLLPCYLAVPWSRTLHIHLLNTCSLFKNHMSMAAPQKIKNRVTIWPRKPRNPSSVYLPKKLEKIYSQRHMHPFVRCSIIHGGHDMETTQVSFNRELDKEDVVHTFYVILLSLKNWWNSATCNTMAGLWEYYAKQNKSVRKSKTIWFHSHVGHKTETLRHRQQYGNCQREGKLWEVVKGAKYTVREDDLTLVGRHPMQCTDRVCTQNTIAEMYTKPIWSY